MSEKLRRFGVPLLSVITGVILGFGVANLKALFLSDPTVREFNITARRYAYDPPRIRVNQGDTVRIRLASLDVEHGFFLEGYDLDARVFANRKDFQVRNPSGGGEWREVRILSFVADRRGKFRYRCSQTCGTLHPFMQGELLVRPNILYYAGLGSVFGLFLGTIWMFSNRTTREQPEEGPG